MPELSGRQIGLLSPEACLTRLDALGVPYRRETSASGVAQPLRLGGPVGGVIIRTHGDTSVNDVIDCRLAVALAAWAPALREAGIEALRHFSIHRPGAHVAGTDHVSGHAKALAIDLAALELVDGSEIEVLSGWERRDAGRDPCADYDEGEASARLRGVVCAAVRSGLFQVVITPHHDRAHRNHVHLELVPGVPWSFVR